METAPLSPRQLAARKAVETRRANAAALVLASPSAVVEAVAVPVEEEPEQREPHASDSDLTKWTTVREMVAAYERTVATVKRTFAEIVAAEAHLNGVFGLDSYDRIRVSPDYPTYDFDDPSRVLEQLHRSAWRSIVDKLEVRRMVSIERWNKLEENLKRGELPEITEANVRAFVEGYYRDLDKMLEEAIREVHDWLRPRSGEYKTNSLYEVGERVVLTCAVEMWSGWFEVRHYTEPRLVALENVFSALDGKGQIAKGSWSAVRMALKDAGSSGHAKTEYFEVRAYKNGNLHLHVLRADLLKVFNQVAGGMRLRCAPEHDPKAQRGKRSAA